LVSHAHRWTSAFKLTLSFIRPFCHQTRAWYESAIERIPVSSLPLPCASLSKCPKLHYQFYYAFLSSNKSIKELSVIKWECWSEPVIERLPPTVFAFLSHRTWAFKWISHQMISHQSSDDFTSAIHVLSAIEQKHTSTPSLWTRVTKVNWPLSRFYLPVFPLSVVKWKLQCKSIIGRILTCSLHTSLSRVYALLCQEQKH